LFLLKRLPPPLSWNDSSSFVVARSFKLGEQNSSKIYGNTKQYTAPELVKQKI
jgi:hypothetical protein